MRDVLHDAIVVGAGPAGCAAAYDLAAAGAHVLLFDRRQFPRVKACAGGLTIKTLQRLRYSVAPVVRQECTGVVLGKGLGERALFETREPICAMTVRAELDAFCLERTRERGAEFRVIRHIEAIGERPDHVVLETTSGPLRARYLIGADGANSVVRRFLPGAGPATLGFAIEAEARIAPLPAMEFDFAVVPHGYGWLFPKADHVNVGLFTTARGVRPARAELAAYARRRLGNVALERVVGHNIGVACWQSVSATRRTVLVGDAAGLTEPLLGEGIHNAIASGQAAAAAVLAARRGGDLAAEYRQRMRPLLADLKACARTAQRFYQHVDLGYRMLTLPLVAGALIHGYARGVPFSAVTSWSVQLARTQRPVRRVRL